MENKDEMQVIDNIELVFLSMEDYPEIKNSMIKA
mgnify:CR=1 FL=1